MIRSQLASVAREDSGRSHPNLPFGLNTFMILRRSKSPPHCCWRLASAETYFQSLTRVAQYSGQIIPRKV
jgi:hypothetical protein